MITSSNGGSVMPNLFNVLVFVSKSKDNVSNCSGMS